MTENEETIASNSQAKVEPIKNLKDILAIKKLLVDNPRNSTLFILGVNTNLMPSELIHLKVRQVKDLSINEPLILVDEKSGKEKRITINRIAHQSIRSLLDFGEYADEDFLFKSQRGNLVVPSVHRLVTKWCEAIHLEGNFGSHTLRKTWGYHQHFHYGVEISQLMHYFNHSSAKQTREYLCITETEEKKDIFLNEL